MTNSLQINENNIKLQGQVQTNLPYDNYIQKKSEISFNVIKTKIQSMIEMLCQNDKELTSQEKINQKFLDLDFGSEFDVNADKIGVNDAIFFVNILNQANIIEYKVDSDNLSISVNDKQINPTNSLLSMLKTSFDTKKPIRLDFDNDVTVSIKLDKEGKIQAHFIPGTKEVETYLKQNIPSLRQTFEDENIGYSYLGYSKSKDNGSKRQQKKDKRGED